MEPNLRNFNTDVYHTKYAEVLVNQHDFAGAHKHFNIALKHNPDSQKAKEGLARMERIMADEEEEEEEEAVVEELDDAF
jgi:TolA-binding protein